MRIGNSGRIRLNRRLLFQFGHLEFEVPAKYQVELFKQTVDYIGQEFKSVIWAGDTKVGTISV